MSYYCLAAVDVHDADAYGEYHAGNMAILKNLQFRPQPISEENLREGDLPASRMVLIEFPDELEFLKWWNSEEYAEITTIRHRAADTKFVLTFGDNEAAG
jgi:uncharacterized protein (DUF1330 family)